MVVLFTDQIWIQKKITDILDNEVKHINKQILPSTGLPVGADPACCLFCLIVIYLN